jgi:tellurite resistance protein TerC
MGWTWVAFSSAILLLLYFDLHFLNKKQKEVHFKEALLWSGFWIGLALFFNLIIFIWKGKDPAISFLTGYLVEKSLSIDNIFVFLVIFKSLHIPKEHQHRVLYLGILGAMIMRAIFIAGGVALLSTFYWATYVFGAFLIITGIRLFFQKESNYDPKYNFVFKLFSNRFRFDKNYTGDRFFIKKNGRSVATRLFLALIVIETADVVFALDSIPAILAITPDPFIVYTSNLFAILGLRSLYFAFAGIVHQLKYLHYGLGVTLIFIGTKMSSEHHWKIPTEHSLLIIGLILLITVLLSLVLKEKDKK